jgi:hypothetical protein
VGERSVTASRCVGHYVVDVPQDPGRRDAALPPKQRRLASGRSCKALPARARHPIGLSLDSLTSAKLAAKLPAAAGRPLSDGDRMVFSSAAERTRYRGGHARP